MKGGFSQLSQLVLVLVEKDFTHSLEWFGLGKGIDMEGILWLGIRGHLAGVSVR